MAKSSAIDGESFPVTNTRAICSKTLRPGSALGHGWGAPPPWTNSTVERRNCHTPQSQSLVVTISRTKTQKDWRLAQTQKESLAFRRRRLKVITWLSSLPIVLGT